MSDQEKMNAAKQFMTMFFSMLTIALPTLAQSQQFTALTTAAMGAIPFFFACGSFAWSIYSHHGMKKVPDAATAVILPTGPEPVGKVLDLAPMSGLAKVVGVILIAVIALPALAAEKRPALTGNPVNDIENAISQPGGPLAKVSNDIATTLSNLADFADAATLATSIPGLQDNVGSACWQQFSPIQSLLKAHPLPLTFKVAVDIEALRLLALGLNQVCGNPNCKSMWTDAGDAANALASTPLPVSLAGICSKVPVITTAAAVAASAAAPIGTAIPAVVPVVTTPPPATPPQ